MAIEKFGILSDGRPSVVRIRSAVDIPSAIWLFEEPSRVEVAAGGIIIWEFDGLSGIDRPLIRIEGVTQFDGEPQVPRNPFFETVAMPRNGIVGRVFAEARGSFRYNVDVERDGVRIQLRCEPAKIGEVVRMGGIDVSGPPVRGG